MSTKTTSIISAASVNATVCKASTGHLYNIYASNINAAAAYLKIYNKATTPSETDTPVLRILIPGSATGGVASIPFSEAVGFSAGISFRVTTALADNSTSAVAANEVAINLTYQ